MKTIFKLIAALFLYGCAPSLSNTISISPVPTSQVRTHVRNVLRPVRVDVFDDMRVEKWIAEVKEGRKVEHTEPLGPLVQDAVSRTLTAAGFSVSDSADYAIVGDIKRWNVKVEVNFPSSSAIAEAVLDVYVLDSRARIIFSSSYGGSTTTERPMIEDQIPELLKESMQLAIGEALNDQKLLRVLKTY